MATLKFWNDEDESWVSVGATAKTTGYVPLTGGRMTGRLTIDTGEPANTQLAVHGDYGSIKSDAFIGGTFDGNIRFSTERTVDVNHARVAGTGEPVHPDSAATKGHIDRRFMEAPPFIPLFPIPKGPWIVIEHDFQIPGYRINNNIMVVLEGVIFMQQEVEPGTPSAVLTKLRPSARPSSQRNFPVIGSGDMMYIISIETDGTISIKSGPVIEEGGYISLDSVRYTV